MVLEIPADLEQALHSLAQQRRTTVDAVVREAIDWYLSIDPDTLDELAAWQEVRDEALSLVEETPP
jgi:predicted transcriptional regulator